MINRINLKEKEIRMSIIADIRNIYSNIPKQDPPKTTLEPSNEDLMKQTIAHLNKAPELTPRVK